ncbi:uncharacterized protein [Primulina eburnea]|uniref:uncharacterized protein isoform X2 n=1 Tax=Primulina eburnea TaxID=1245227 RepID=UPI003C6C45CA
MLIYKKKREGKLKIEGAKDGILTKALETEEHAGRVRGIGGHITPTIYFNGGRNWKGSEHKRELMEAKKKISEQDARIKKLEAIMYKSGACDMSIDDKGSCSVKLNQMRESDMKHDDVELKIVSKFDVLQGKQVALTLEGSKNIVAYGTVVCVKGEDKLIHGVPLPHNCIRVSIDEAVDKSTPLPVPIPSECETIGDAVGTFVVWPEHLIVKSNEAERKTIEQPMKKHHLSASVPRSLYMLYCYSKRALDEGRYISMILDHDVFGDDYKLILHLDDIIPLYHLDPISDNCVVGYIWHLYKNLLKDQKMEKFRFVNPHRIPYVSKNTQDKTGKLERLNHNASVIADRLSGASVDQLVFVPYNIGFHWILVVIEPYKEVIYLLDSLYHRIRDEDWKYVVETALRLFNSNKGRKGRKNALWEVVKAPRQPDAKQCGYYVMRFMRQIIEEISTIERDSLRSIFTKSEYSREEIDEVRSELAECI